MDDLTEEEIAICMEQFQALDAAAADKEENDIKKALIASLLSSLSSSSSSSSYIEDDEELARALQEIEDGKDNNTEDVPNPQRKLQLDAAVHRLSFGPFAGPNKRLVKQNKDA